MADDITIKIQTAIDDANSAKTLGDLKKSLKELQSLSLQVGDNTEGFKKLSQAIGDGKDKIEDLNDSVKSLKGTGVEKLNASWGLLKESVTTFDPSKATTALKGLGSAFKAIPIFLVIEGIQLLIENFDKIVQFFPIVGKAVKVVTDIFYKLTDAIGLTTHADDEMTANTLKNTESRKAAATTEYDLQIRLAKAAHKETTDLELAKQNAIIETSNVVIRELNRRAAAGHQLTKDENKSLEEAKASLREAEVAKVEIVSKAEDDKAEKRKKAAEEHEKIEKKKQDALDKLAEKAKKQQEENDAAELKSTEDLVNKAKSIREEEYLRLTKTEQERVQKKLELDLAELESTFDKSNRSAEAYASLQQSKVDLTAKANADIAALNDAAEEKLKLAAASEQERVQIKLQSDLDELQSAYDNSDKSAEAYANLQNAKVSLTAKANADIAALNKAARDKEEAKDKEEQAKKIARLNQNTQLTKASLEFASTLSSIFYNKSKINLETANKAQIEEARKNAKKQFEIQKAFQLAGAVVDGYKAVVSAYAGTIGGPVIKGIAAVTAGIFSAAQIAKISSSTFDDSSFKNAQAAADKDAEKAAKDAAKDTTSTSSVGTLPTLSTGISAAAAPAFSSNSGTEFTKQMVNTVGETTSTSTATIPGQAPPQRVYVVESDITNTQQKVAVTESKATIGN